MTRYVTLFAVQIYNLLCLHTYLRTYMFYGVTQNTTASEGDDCKADSDGYVL